MEPLIYGKYLNSSKRLNREIREFRIFYERSLESKPIDQAIWDFIKTRPWRQNASDMRAFWFHYELTFLAHDQAHPESFLKQYLDTRESAIEKIALKREKELEAQSSEKAYSWYEKRCEAIDRMDGATNEYDRLEISRIEFMPAHKAFLKACGKKPCKARTCTAIVTSSHPKAQYCSKRCKSREANRRSREKNPKAKMRSDLKYLKCLEKYGDLDSDEE